MEKKYLLDIVINREKLSDGTDIYVSHCPSLGIASQGDTIEKAMKMIKEVVELYLEELPEKCEELELERNDSPIFSVIEVKKNGKNACIVR